MQLAAISLIIPDYDAAIAYYSDVFGMSLFEDRTVSEQKRWVVLGYDNGARFVLARAQTPQEKAAIGAQGAGRVWLFLETARFDDDFAALHQKGVIFEEHPRHEPYGRVVKFRDSYGNRWDLMERSPQNSLSCAYQKDR